MARGFLPFPAPSSPLGSVLSAIAWVACALSLVSIAVSAICFFESVIGLAVDVARFVVSRVVHLLAGCNSYSRDGDLLWASQKLWPKRLG